MTCEIQAVVVGLCEFLGLIVDSTEDPEVHFKYIEVGRIIVCNCNAKSLSVFCCETIFSKLY